jgi:FixJ family two-component response regulator
VDDDKSVREALPDLLREFGFVVETFALAKEFLAFDRSKASNATHAPRSFIKICSER